MPVYLLHGFRWPRAGFTGIRVHAIVHNLEECSAEYIQNENSKMEILGSFRKAYPEIMKELESSGRGLEFLEQYDPEDESGVNAVSQPYAFVADRVIIIAGGPKAQASTQAASLNAVGSMSPASSRMKSPITPSSNRTNSITSVPNASALSMNVEEVMSEGPGLSARAWEALADLRDKIADGEKIGWWVIYNGDPERAYDDVDEDEDDDDDDDATEVGEVFLTPPQHAPHEKNFVPFPLPETTLAFRQQPTSPERPRTAGATSTSPVSSGTFSVFPPMPNQQREQGKRTMAMTAAMKEGKEARDEMYMEPSKPKENVKQQSLRRKFFGRRS